MTTYPRRYGDPAPMASYRRARWLERFDSWLRRHRWFTDTVIALVLAFFLMPFSWGLAIATFGEDGYSLGGATSLLLVPVTLIAHCAIALRRSYPVTVFLIVVGSLAFKVVVTGIPFPTDLLFLVALYTVCAYAPSPWPTIGLMIGFAGAAIECLRMAIVVSTTTIGRTEGPAAAFLLIFFFLFMVAAVLASWGVGQFRRVRYAYFATLEDRTRRAEAEREERAARAVIEERSRIAREMHDVVAHSLAVIVSQAQGGQYAAKKNPDRAVEVLGTIAETSRTALTDMRGLLGVLREADPAAGRGGAIEQPRGPQPALNQLDELINRVKASGLGVERTEQGNPKQLGTSGELAVFRLVQESLTNTLKHAGPGATATVAMNWAPDALELAVTDTGRGITAQDTAELAGGGHGLVGMRERIAVVGGEISAGPRSDGGFAVTARIPYRQVR